MSRIADWEVLVGRAAQTITERRGSDAPASVSDDNPSDNQTDGLVFLGNVHETVPRALLVDRRLGAIDVLGWQIIRMLCNADRTTAFPTYDELQPLLRSSAGKRASRGSVARVMAILRLTRWLSLSHRARHATNGRVIGNVYVLHDEPIGPAEANVLDKEYFEFVKASLNHKNNAVSAVARLIHDELAQQGFIDKSTRPEPKKSRAASEQPDAMERFNQRARRFHEMQPGSRPSSQRELGQFSQRTKSKNSNLDDSSHSELRAGQSRTTPSSHSELSLKSDTYRLVSIANSVPTTVRSSINIRTGSKPESSQRRELFWSDLLELHPSEQASITASLSVLPPDIQQAVLDETAGKVAAGKSSSPKGLLHTLIKRASTGEFRPTQHAQSQAERRGERYEQVSEQRQGHSPQPPVTSSRPAPSAAPKVPDPGDSASREEARRVALQARDDNAVNFLLPAIIIR
ncbi:STY4528 family pathogenicity island replication protein [Vreelandella zhaodongensis]|uniref:STY4528 family pathogenicity island replication protein n=1 Tax=Vreelandella zhaodongensis TaxID=1176240 RepID=UPI003EBF1B2A